MLEIALDNCYKCNLETVTDPNDNQYFWINRRDLEIANKRNWQVIFDKYKDLSAQKYKRALIPNITFQPNKIFVRNDLFQKVIKSCKATNLEFLKFKEKLGSCLYEDICDEKEFILMSEESLMQHDVINKQLKEENENEKRETRNEKPKSRNEKLEMTNENEQFEKIKTTKEEPKEIKSPNWINKNKFKKILAIIDSNEFNYKNKIDEFKHTDIIDLVSNIRNNTIGEIDAKKLLNALSKIKKAEIIKYKKRTPGHKNFFDDLLDTTLTDKTLESQENEKVESKKEGNEYEDYEMKMKIIKMKMKMKMKMMKQ